MQYELHSAEAVEPLEERPYAVARAGLRLASVLPAGVAGSAVFFMMPSLLGNDLWRGYGRLATVGLASVGVWALLGIAVLVVSSWILIEITEFDVPGAAIRSALWIGGISALSLTAAGISMGVALDNVYPQRDAAPGSGVVVVVALLGAASLAAAVIAQIVSYARGASHRPPSGGSVSSTEAGLPMNGSATAVSEP